MIVDELIGKEIDRYRIIQHIGGGSFGQVFKSVHVEFANRIVATKIIPPKENLSVKEKARIRKEIATLEKLSHQNIVKIKDTGIVDGTNPPAKVKTLHVHWLDETRNV